ncbi:MAG TPA: hopanoid C-3 methylase HpnR [Acetobacteraceae bacterium]
MKLLAVHPGPLMYTKVFLRLEPLGLELVAAAALRGGHQVRIIDLQVDTQRTYLRSVQQWQPDVVAFSCNYLANVPEIVDLAKLTRQLHPGCVIVVGGHSVSFTAPAMLDHAGGAIDCVLRGEGEAVLPLLLAAIGAGQPMESVPGAVTANGEGPAPVFVDDLDALQPARHLLHHRRKYFIGTLDPAASIEFSRGCPWDCSFCSAWTFYGRTYRLKSPERVVDDLAAIPEPGVFIVDDVAFVRAEHGMAIAEAIARRGIRKQYYLETRGDVLLRHREVFREWRRLGLKMMFLGLEAIDEEGLKKFRKRVNLSRNFEALDYARSLGINVAINLIADPDWDHARFETVRQWCMEIPDVVNISVNTPYPGTETWVTESRKLQTLDYRLFDIQHCVLPTKLPLDEFYHELTKTQQVLNRKHLGWRTLWQASGVFARLALRGQTNFLRNMFHFNSVYDAQALLADHRRPVAYELPQPPQMPAKLDRAALYVHSNRSPAARSSGAPPEPVAHAGG